jgi:hypothetical protein
MPIESAGAEANAEKEKVDKEMTDTNALKFITNYYTVL